MGRHRTRNPLEFLLPLPAAVIMLTIAVIVSFSPAVPVSEPSQLTFQEECQQALDYPDRSSQDVAFLNQCVHALQFRDAPTTPPATTTVAPTTPPVTTTPPATTTAPPTPTPSPTGPPVEGCAPFPLFPTPGSTAEGCTGFRHNVAESQLRVCQELDGENDNHLTRTQVFDGCRFNGLLRIRAQNIVIRNSLITGCIATHHTSRGQYMNLTVADTEITGVCTSMAPISDGRDYTCLRCYVHDTGTGLGGGSNVTIRDSYVTRMVYSDGAHQAAIGMNNGLGIVIEHNNLNCFRIFPPGVPQNQGCSAALSLYDEGPLDGVLVKNNLFNAAGEYCAYSGGPTGRNVRFIDNRFGMVHHPNCGNSGPLHSWYPSNVGYVWSGNQFTDGRIIVR